MLHSECMHSDIAYSHPLNLRVSGRLAAELTEIAKREHNSISAVARRLITESLSRAHALHGQGESFAHSTQEAMDAHA